MGTNKGGKKKKTRFGRRFASPFSPFLGPSRLVTNPSRFALAFVPDQSAKKDAPEEEAGLAQYALSLTVSVLISTILDPNIMNKSGRILITAELAHEYGFKDFGG